mmetsp:Transcript_78612/g.227217  ORF Transcript_78612/g.227217 Transcript_78612/m.227217 type:complete len:280 (-) Transcript_78612:355-1194(-)
MVASAVIRLRHLRQEILQRCKCVPDGVSGLVGAMPAPSSLVGLRLFQALSDHKHEALMFAHRAGKDRPVAADVHFSEELLQLRQLPRGRVTLAATPALAKRPPQIVATGPFLEGLDACDEPHLLRVGENDLRRRCRMPGRRLPKAVVDRRSCLRHGGKPCCGVSARFRLRAVKEGNELLVRAKRWVSFPRSHFTPSPPEISAAVAALHGLDALHGFRMPVTLDLQSIESTDLGSPGRRRSTASAAAIRRRVRDLIARRQQTRELLPHQVGNLRRVVANL